MACLCSADLIQEGWCSEPRDCYFLEPETLSRNQLHSLPSPQPTRREALFSIAARRSRMVLDHWENVAVTLKM